VENRRISSSDRNRTPGVHPVAHHYANWATRFIVLNSSSMGVKWILWLGVLFSFRWTTPTATTERLAFWFVLGRSWVHISPRRQDILNRYSSLLYLVPPGKYYRITPRTLLSTAQEFSLLHVVQTESGPPTQLPTQRVPGVLSSEVKHLGRGAEHSLPISAEDKKMCIYIPSSPYASMV
jgi:hypothetical protein